MAAAAPNTFAYPNTKEVDQVDHYFGTAVKDPFRWLEDDVRNSKDVDSWVTEQNKVTFKYLEEIPERQLIRDTITWMWNYERFSTPWKTGGRYFYFKNDGLQNQAVLYTVDSLQDNKEGQVLLDPNTLSADGTVALSGATVSECGKFLAYGLSSAGSDWIEWHVRDIDSGADLPDLLKWVKFSGVAWTADSKGFFYSRYDAPSEDQAFQALNKYQKLYYHRIRTPQDEDTLVYHRPDEADWGFSSSVSEDGRYLIITIWKGTDPNYRVMYKDLSEPYGCPIDLISTFDNEYNFLANEGPVFYFKTNLDATRGRVVAIDTRKPARAHWREVIPQSEQTLEDVSVVHNQLVASYLLHAVTVVRVYTLQGVHVRDIQLPGIGTASGFRGLRSDTESFFVFSSYNRPATIYRLDMITGQTSLMRRPKAHFDSDLYETTQVFYPSKDGTRIPMFLCYRKDIALQAGDAPLLLYGYGGFNISMTPSFSISVAAWMAMGGIYAVANIRGGGEYGKEWNDAGKKLNKQNCFDDFISAAEWLVANKYTNPSRLAITGGSNGGLLVGACMTQRPDLFAACIPAVGVMDMLRFHHFTAGRFWVDEYGSAEASEADFTNLHRYSPYHNLRAVNYPATMVTTADTDDRVVPGHSFKFAAKLQQVQAGPAPVLIRIETKAGHGAGKPTAKVIEEVADKYSFLTRILRLTIPASFRPVQ